MNKSEELFMQYCRESGMDDDDIRACSWHKAGMIDFADWLLCQNSGKPLVMRPLPPSLPDIELALNLAQAELRSMYRRLGYKGSNVLDLVDKELEKVQAAMSS